MRFPQTGRKYPAIFWHNSTFEKQVFLKRKNRSMKVAFLTGYVAKEQLRSLSYGEKTVPRKFLRDWPVPGLIGAGKLATLVAKKMPKHILTKCSIWCAHKWQHQIHLNGLTLDCTGPMV